MDCPKTDILDTSIMLKELSHERKRCTYMFRNHIFSSSNCYIDSNERLTIKSQAPKEKCCELVEGEKGIANRASGRAL